MTAPDLRASLTWLSVCNDALLAGSDWRPASDRYLRGLPLGEKLAPTMFAVVLAQHQARGADPAMVLQLIDDLLNILATVEGWAP